ncbi:MAG: hypothetical protein ABSA85_02565 [Terracidiphilus sp.]|jgi:hypothetical protein
MYMICRHIKINGLRCESPALRGHQFCYYHSKAHTVGAEPHLKYGPLQLPTPEDAASIQLSVARISDAIINGRIDLKKATGLLYGLQIAAQSINLKQVFDREKTVQSAEQTADGDELAPEECIDKNEDGSERFCAATGQCTCRSHTGNKIEDADIRDMDDDGERALSTGMPGAATSEKTPSEQFANFNCETVPYHLTNEDSAACSHRAAPVQSQCNCTPAVRQT